HLDVLSQYGFKCYRGPEPVWHETLSLPRPIRRVARLFEVATSSTPPVSLPERDQSGLWNIPGSTIYFPMHGIRRLVPMQVRIRRVLKGLSQAAKRKRIFHLWFHPTNLADQTDAMIAGLHEMLSRAVDLRHRGVLEILTMGEIAQRCESKDR